MEGLDIIHKKIPELENLGLAIGNRFELATLEASLQSGANLGTTSKLATGFINAVCQFTCSISSIGVNVSSPICVYTTWSGNQ